MYPSQSNLYNVVVIVGSRFSSDNDSVRSTVSVIVQCTTKDTVLGHVVFSLDLILWEVTYVSETVSTRTVAVVL